MKDIIDFKERKDRKEIDPHLILDMPDGTTWFKYGATYQFKDSEFGFGLEIWAQNDKEAQERIEAIKATLTLEGRIYSDGETEL